MGVKNFQANIILKIDTRNVFFVYCDLLDPGLNLLNGKKTTLLAKFDIRGKPFEKNQLSCI